MNKEKVIHVAIGKTLNEWKERYGSFEEFWDFSVDDMQSGAIEPNPNIYYWLIDGRFYETDIRIV